MWDSVIATSAIFKILIIQWTINKILSKCSDVMGLHLPKNQEYSYKLEQYGIKFEGVGAVVDRFALNRVNQ